MNRLSSFKSLLFASFFILAAGICYPMPPEGRTALSNVVPEALSQQKKAKLKRPVSAEKAQKKAGARDKARRKDSAKYIEENRKRSIEIQTPEVQERMKQNVKDANARYKAKKKTSSSRTRKAGRKYR
ncbi:MAG: hypothetical protein V1903_05275 [Bacteroidota bacterium]